MKSPSTNGNNGRNTNGQFAKGNKHGTGNPYARRVAQLRSTLLDAVGENGLADIVQGMVSAAKGGDVAAAKLLLSYLLGKPTDAIEPDAVQIHEKQLRAKENDIDHDEQLAQVLGLLRSDL
jgi:hypothetical protein